MKKNPFSLQLNLDSFIPATDAEKEYMVKMRPSSTFFKDGVKRLLKNPVATVAFFLIVIITLSCIIIPMFWPYAYDQMLGNTPGQPMDGSYKNLSPFDYGSTERMKLLGTANAQVFTFPVEAKNEKMLNAQKKDAEKLLESYRAGAMTSESFAALESTLDDKGDVYVRHDAVKPSVFGSKEATVEQWLWEVDWLGDGVRVAGDASCLRQGGDERAVRHHHGGVGAAVVRHVEGVGDRHPPAVHL